jgi:PKD repeat protein
MTGIEAVHAFEVPGEHTVTLTVTDGGGNTGTDTMTVTVVDDEDPVADAGEDPTGVTAGDTVTLSASNSTDNAGIVNYTWEFTDVSPMALYGETVEYVFDEAGEFVVTLTVRDDAGNTDTDTVTVTVSEPPVNDPPIADAGDDEVISAGTEYTFDGSGSSSDATNFTWTFVYDGGTETLYGETANWTFDSSGEYTVTLTVTDDLGATDTDTVTITVEGEGYPLSLLLTAGILTAFVVVAAAILLMRRKRPSEGSPPEV